MMLHRQFLLLAMFFLATPAAAQSVEGTWDFRVDDTTIFRFEIDEGEHGEWSGSWSRPETFVTDGNRFARLSGEVKTTPSMAGIEFLGNIELSFDDPRPGAVPDIFRFALLSDDAVEMTYVGTDLAPYALVRAGADDPMGDWEQGRVYARPLPGGDAPIEVAPVRPEEDTDDFTPEEAGPDDANSEEPAADRLGSDFLEGL